MADQSTQNASGSWEVNRAIPLPALQKSADATNLSQAVSALSGVHKAEADTEKHRLVLRYNSAEIDYLSIVHVLEEKGYRPSDSWWARMKAKWYQFTDVNARENANAPPPACCNKPPKGRK